MLWKNIKSVLLILVKPYGAIGTFILGIAMTPSENDIVVHIMLFIFFIILTIFSAYFMIFA